ncbi:MAG: hypothetical protein AABZ65_01445 [Candidatus Omnitrophota bacterium]
MSKFLFPVLTFIAVFISHIVFFKFINSGCQADGAGRLAAYVRLQEYYLGFSYAVSLTFAAFAFMKFKECKRKAFSAGIGIGAWTVILWTAGCFLSGCCGSPMWMVYFNLLGISMLKIPKWSIAGISLAMVSLSYLWLIRRSPKYCLKEKE